MKKLAFLLAILTTHNVCAQFHTLTMPRQSPAASLQQQVGVTFIEISYCSPAARNRDVWNNPNVIPQKGDPIAWRAGANENTTIAFDTDVQINGQHLAKGSYGFHIIPNGHSHTLLFSEKDNLWGSYYLDLDKDVALKVSVTDSSIAYTEFLQFTVLDRSANSCDFGLAWGDRIIPFTISVNLEQTAVEKWRYELSGDNTYQWEAWNDAASWCLQHNTNLQEALDWVNRSINGGYGGFAAYQSFVNLSTKIELLDALDRKDELTELLQYVKHQDFSIDEAHYMIASLFHIGSDAEAKYIIKKGLKSYKDDWGLHLYLGVSNYYLGDQKAAFKAFEKCKSLCPEWFHPRLAAIEKEMKSDTYQFPGRKV